MATISILNVSGVKSFRQIEGTIAVSITFSSTEVKLDIGFRPVLYATPSDECVKPMEVGFESSRAGAPHLPDAALRTEVSLPQDLVHPSGHERVERTYLFAIEKSALFRGDFNELFERPNAGLNFRVEISPDITGSNASVKDHKL